MELMVVVVLLYTCQHNLNYVLFRKKYVIKKTRVAISFTKVM